jgi:uncharacterized membrane protein YhaH (DUF805 family)
MLTFGDAINLCLKRRGEWKGRSTRSEFWWGLLFCLLLLCTTLIIGILLEVALEDLGVIIYTVVYLFILWGLFTPLCARRFHDAGWSAWYILTFSLIPIIGWGMILYILLKKSEPKLNKWGYPAEVVIWPKYGIRSKCTQYSQQDNQTTN